MRMFLPYQGPTNNVPVAVGTPVQTDAQGQFVIQPAPVVKLKLMADGGTAQRPGALPTVEFDMVTRSILKLPVLLFCSTLAAQTPMPSNVLGATLQETA